MTDSERADKIVDAEDQLVTALENLMGLGLSRHDAERKLIRIIDAMGWH